MIKNKIFIVAFLSLFLLSFVSAELVEPNTFVDLPQLTSGTPLDTEGTLRTYLYCTWHIDDIGVEVEQMTTLNCPPEEQTFYFTDDQTYVRRIDAAQLQWSNLFGWQVLSTSVVEEVTIDYNLDLLEP